MTYDSLVTAQMLCFRGKRTPGQAPFLCGRKVRGRRLRGLLAAHGGKSVRKKGWSGRSQTPPLRVRRGVSVGEKGIERSIRTFLRVKAAFLGKNHEIRTLASGRETSIASLCGCCARGRRGSVRQGGRVA